MECSQRSSLAHHHERHDHGQIPLQHLHCGRRLRTVGVMRAVVVVLRVHIRVLQRVGTTNSRSGGQGQAVGKWSTRTGLKALDGSDARAAAAAGDAAAVFASCSCFSFMRCASVLPLPHADMVGCSDDQTVSGNEQTRTKAVARGWDRKLIAGSSW